jgi:CDP-diacylglycerol---glycerol-3-phosphate 3-phosphatidyltransferase
LTANAISLTGFALNLGAAGLVFAHLFFLAGIVFILGSSMDTLDGRYSRMAGKETTFGAFLDATLDRIDVQDRAGHARGPWCDPPDRPDLREGSLAR